jgi:D-alanyl-D-alanine dipeptidase
MKQTMAVFNKILSIGSVLVAIINPRVQAYSQEPNSIKKFNLYCNTIANEPEKMMLEVKKAIPAVEYDLRYATKNNFTGRKLYKSGKHTYLRASVIQALRQVEIELEQKNLTLKIFDAYRPYRVTKLMWDLIHDTRYVADPSKGSRHNRGLAVDLTIIDRTTHKELNMGTGFDNFTDSAHHSFKNLPATVLENRTYLKDIMVKHGFNALETEWWHYSLSNNKNYEVLDIDFRKLETSCY